MSRRAVALGLALYVLRIFATGAGYHRYFAHRAFRASSASWCWHPSHSVRRSAAFCGGLPSTVGTTGIRTPQRRSLASAGRDVLERAGDLPGVPTLEEVRRYARERLAQMPSLEEIAVRARERLLELIHARLNEAAGSPAA
jgi:hypothetical protein